MVYDDPKPGRWILPLIILGMVGLTYAFVNSLEPAPDPSGTLPNGGTATTEPIEPTTTLPSDVAEFLLTVDIFENQVRSFATEVNQINARWEDRANSGVTFAQTRTAFLNSQTQLRNFDAEVGQTPNVPADLAPAHLELLIRVSELPVLMEEIVLGLDAPDDGTARRGAVAEFNAQIDRVLEAIEEIRSIARGEPPEMTTTTLDDSEEGTEDGETEG